MAGVTLPCVVEVQCPHKIGLCYLVDYGSPVGRMLTNLPCPCNDKSEIVRWFIAVPREAEDVEEFLNDPN